MKAAHLKKSIRTNERSLDRRPRAPDNLCKTIPLQPRIELGKAVFILINDLDTPIQPNRISLFICQRPHREQRTRRKPIVVVEETQILADRHSRTYGDHDAPAGR